MNPTLKSPPVSPRGYQAKQQNQTITHGDNHPGSRSMSPSKSKNPFPKNTSSNQDEPGYLSQAASKVKEKGKKIKDRVTGEASLQISSPVAGATSPQQSPIAHHQRNLSADLRNRLASEERGPVRQFAHDVKENVRERIEDGVEAVRSIAQDFLGVENVDRRPLRIIDGFSYVPASEINPAKPMEVVSSFIPENKPIQHSRSFLVFIDNLLDQVNAVDNRFFHDTIPDSLVNRVKLGMSHFSQLFSKKDPESASQELESGAINEETRLIEDLAKKALHALTGLESAEYRLQDGTIGHRFIYAKQSLSSAFEHIAALNLLNPSLGSDFMRLIPSFVHGIFDEKEEKKVELKQELEMKQEAPIQPIDIRENSSLPTVEVLTDSQAERLFS